jgi:Flp pilus assembly protein TadG
MGSSRRLRFGDGGAALVEFALLLPFLAILVFGVIDVGRLYGAWNETKNAAREGAAYAQVFPNQQRDYGGLCASPNNAEAKVKQELGDAAVSGTLTVTFSPPVTTCDPSSGGLAPGTKITVKVSRQMTLITPLVRRLLGTPTVTAQVAATVQG